MTTQREAASSTAAAPLVVEVTDQRTGERSVCWLTASGVTLGTERIGNTLQLRGEKIGRHHLRIDRDESGVTLRDLGLGGVVWQGLRLQPGDEQRWQPGQRVALGGYTLALREPRPDDPPADGTGVPVAPSVARDGGTWLAIQLHNPHPISVAPGDEATIALSLHNNGDVHEELQLEVGGVPREWLRLPPEPVGVPAGGAERTSFVVSVPRRGASVAGSRQLTVRAVPVAATSDPVERRLQLIVQPTREPPRLRLRPRSAHGWGEATYDVSLTNAGNVEGSYEIDAESDREGLAFDYDPRRVVLDPGETARVALKARRTGAPEPDNNRYEFVVRATPLGQAPVQLAAQLIDDRAHPPLLSPPNMRAVLLFLAVAGVLLGLIGIASLIPSPRDTPTRTEAAARSAAGYQPVVQAQAARIAQSQVASFQTSFVLAATAQYSQTATAYAPTALAETAVARLAAQVGGTAFTLATGQAVDAQVAQAAANLMAASAAANATQTQLAGGRETAAANVGATGTANANVEATAGAAQTALANTTVAWTVVALQATAAQEATAQAAREAAAAQERAAATAQASEPAGIVFSRQPPAMVDAGDPIDVTVVVRDGTGKAVVANYVVELRLRGDCSRDYQLNGDRVVATISGEAAFSGLSISLKPDKTETPGISCRLQAHVLDTSAQQNSNEFTVN